MNETNHNTFRIILTCGFLVWILALGSGTGCSRAVISQNREVMKKWSCNQEADEAMKRRDYAMGISLHSKFLEKEPENALAFYHLGYAYGQMGEYLKELSFYEKAIALGFQDDQIFFNLGMCYGELKQLERSVAVFQSAVEKNPGNTVYRLCDRPESHCRTDYRRS